MKNGTCLMDICIWHEGGCAIGDLQIVEAITPVRDNMDAILVFPSMPAVMRLNKLGSFAMEQLGQGKSIIKDFMRSQRKNNENFEESLLQLVRTLPKVHLPSMLLGTSCGREEVPILPMPRLPPSLIRLVCTLVSWQICMAKQCCSTAAVDRPCAFCNSLAAPV